jgi:ABC-type branched-subunit amino acid transport system ATPase component
MEPDSELLKVDGVSKAFPGILANDTITFDLKEGEIHALLGENGAGKTPLVGILYGLLHPDAGHILVNGKVLEPGNPREALSTASDLSSSTIRWSPRSPSSKILFSVHATARAALCRARKSSGGSSKYHSGTA